MDIQLVKVIGEAILDGGLKAFPKHYRYGVLIFDDF
jgi:hypothetical protein